MKNLYLFFILLIFLSSLHAQAVTVSEKCISNTITLSKVPNENNKMAYLCSGTVYGFYCIALEGIFSSPN